MAVSLEAKTGRASGRDRGDQRPDSEDIHCSGQIIGQNREGHLGGYFWKSFGQEVRRSHACLHRAERMLDSLATKAHSEGVRIEPLLHCVEQILVLHRVIRRSDPGVHWGLIEQFLQALVQ